jgi:tetratricopeptide (TPR) repeat protein
VTNGSIITEAIQRASTMAGDSSKGCADHPISDSAIPGPTIRQAVPPRPTEPAPDPPSPADDEALAMVARAQAHVQAGELDLAVHVATQAAALRARPDVTLPALARILEAQGEAIAALDAYGQALAAAPDVAEISREMGRLALRLGKHTVAENVLTLHLKRWPATPDVVADLARAQSGQKAFDRAHETLKAALEADASHPILWRTLADLLSLQGRQADAVVFYEESLRLDFDSVDALDGIADALLLSGDEARALEASEASLAQANGRDRPRIMANHARRLLSAGRLAEGWNAFAQRVWPGEAAAVTVKLAAPGLAPDAPLEGRLLLIGEADVVDELLLAQAVPRLAADGVPVILAVQPLWQALAKRSLPDTMVVTLRDKLEGERRLLTADLDSPHVHGGELIGAWAPLRALPALYCARPEDFAGARAYLTPDPDRVAYWRERQAALGPGPKVGLVWRAPGPSPQPWEAPPLAALKAALDVPGVQLIGVQTQDVQGELVWIRETYGLSVHEPPPELRLWDLDEVAAFCAALDVVAGLPDAATVAAAACGAQTWILSPPKHWMRLGSDAYPWFPAARVMAAEGPGDWDRALGELNAALRELAAGAR